MTDGQNIDPILLIFAVYYGLIHINQHAKMKEIYHAVPEIGP